MSIVFNAGAVVADATGDGASVDVGSTGIVCSEQARRAVTTAVVATARIRWDMLPPRESA
jgi:hypothetical protein